MKTVLEVRDLGFAFGSRPVLSGISFSVGAGEKVGILGPNGAGKSTLLWCLLGLRRARGEVRLFGQRPGDGARRRVGVVFQNPEDLLFMPKLIEDITLPLLNRGLDREDAFRRAGDVLQRMGLNGYAEQPAGHLSLGQRKRAAIAAALAPEPELLVLDEPTAELDGRAVRQLTELLANINAACLITSHDLAMLGAVASRVLVLHDGRIIARGPAREILADRELLDQAELI